MKKSLPRVRVAARVVKRRSPTWRAMVLFGVGVGVGVGVFVGGGGVVGTGSDCVSDILAQLRKSVMMMVAVVVGMDGRSRAAGLMGWFICVDMVSRIISTRQRGKGIERGEGEITRWVLQ